MAPLDLPGRAQGVLAAGTIDACAMGREAIRLGGTVAGEGRLAPS